jgi:hypothetical protein
MYFYLLCPEISLLLACSRLAASTEDTLWLVEHWPWHDQTPDTATMLFFCPFPSALIRPCVQPGVSPDPQLAQRLKSTLKQKRANDMEMEMMRLIWVAV